MCNHFQISYLLISLLICGYLRSTTGRSIDFFKDEPIKPDNPMKKRNIITDIMDMADIFDFDITKDLGLDDYFFGSSEEASDEKYLICKNCTIIVKQDQKEATSATAAIPPVQVSGQSGQSSTTTPQLPDTSAALQTNVPSMQPQLQTATAINIPNKPMNQPYASTPAMLGQSATPTINVVNPNVATTIMRPMMSSSTAPSTQQEQSVPATMTQSSSTAPLAGMMNMAQVSSAASQTQQQTPAQMPAEPAVQGPLQMAGMPDATNKLSTEQLNDAAGMINEIANKIQSAMQA